MKIIETDIPGVMIIEPQVFGDHRGYFMETYQIRAFAEAGIPHTFVQDNQSRSVKNTLRGLHYQDPYAQGKLVRAVAGEVFDVAVDIRRGSPTFGKWTGVILSSENKRSFWVPPGFAHGFCVLSDSADFVYKCSEYYHPETEHTILWNDPDIGIEWPVRDVLLSKKDENGKRLLETTALPSYDQYQ